VLLAELQEHERRLGADRAALQAAVRVARAEAMAATSPAAGDVATRNKLAADAALRLAQAQADDAAVAAELAGVQDERRGVEAELAAQAAAAQAARTDDAVRRELKDAERALDTLRKELDGLQTAFAKAAAREVREQTHMTELFEAPSLIGNREKQRTAWQDARGARRQAQALCADTRAAVEQAKVARDALLGELDRRGRGWVAPTPMQVPDLPELTGDVDADIDTLNAHLARLQRRRERVAGRVNEAQAQRDGVPFDGVTPYGVSIARHRDADTEFRANLRDLGALGEATRTARETLRRIERRAVVLA
jgi:hypothetical protein